MKLILVDNVHAPAKVYFLFHAFEVALYCVGCLVCKSGELVLFSSGALKDCCLSSAVIYISADLDFPPSLIRLFNCYVSYINVV